MMLWKRKKPWKIGNKSKCNTNSIFLVYIADGFISIDPLAVCSVHWFNVRHSPRACLRLEMYDIIDSFHCRALGLISAR